MVKNSIKIKNSKLKINYLFSPKGTAMFLLLNSALFCLFLARTISAQTSMSNGSYIIRFPNLNSFAGKPSNAQYSLGITGGQTAPGLYSGQNYKVRAGFQYIKSIIPFSFSITGIFIDFGPITPGTPITRTNNLTISNGSANGYTVLASENHPLMADSTGVSIPDTTCDSGTCTESIASAWSNLTTFGFGYRCDNVTGSDCQSGFGPVANYRQFSASNSGEIAKPVMRGVNVGRNIQSQITYKVNVSSSQPTGSYQNVITFIAVPSI